MLKSSVRAQSFTLSQIERERKRTREESDEESERREQEKRVMKRDREVCVCEFVQVFWRSEVTHPSPQTQRGEDRAKAFVLMRPEMAHESHTHTHFSPLPSPSEQQLGVVLALQVAVDEVREQVLEDIGGVLQFTLQHCHDERGHVAAVAHGEAALRLERADE